MPMVYTVDGTARREATHTEKRLATYLAEKWRKEYSLLNSGKRLYNDQVNQLMSFIYW